MSGNQILARLPKVELDRLRPYLTSIKFDSGLVLYEAHAPYEYSYFPNRGTLSAVVVMLDGSMIEVATIGSEGMVGLPNLSNAGSSPNRVFVQVPGEGWRIDTKVLLREAQPGSVLQDLMMRYHAAFLFQISQSVACNGLHPLLERCCRWLLMTHDRAEGDEFQLTHEFLAAMLGVRRSSVTETLQIMQEKGLISGARGKITIVDRKGLEAGSCECYRAVTDEYAKLLKF
ncbi:Crp/Fnr family transcriptional regulator [Anatilimnocola sp. NA78]|uniref:Crp/Fnr family transcriptional regulator n=1 Tax=Anatilimnocola sp. NA78 TaxID=3415683 RepID=UPI003CE476A0